MTAKKVSALIAIFAMLADAAVGFFGDATTVTRLIAGVAIGLAIYFAGDLA